MRLYYLHGKPTTLDKVLEELKERLTTEECTKDFRNLSIEWTDIDEREKFETYLTANKRQEILNKSKHIDYENKENLLNYKDDTELCFYKKGKWSVYLAVYDGLLEWTLNKHYTENDWDDIDSLIWNTKDIENLKEVDLFKYSREYMEQFKIYLDIEE